ncbi:MAG: GntR family transcriptional regulator [Eggerthellaceae bacterium]|nr:GntR family transcriptional regulator [Eggerthellaceae bacterium]
MKWEFTNDRSISAQIAEAIEKGVLSGVYPLGSSMPSVRVLALEAGVNPNTMQKAMAELETQGLLYAQRTSGRTVTTDERLIMVLKEKMASDYIRNYFEGMQGLGIEQKEAVEMLVAHQADASFPAKTHPMEPTQTGEVV